jgi:excisionase family DNA binding protein
MIYRNQHKLREVYEVEEYLTVKQVAKYLQVKPLTIYQWARTKKIPAVKIGRI